MVEVYFLWSYCVRSYYVAPEENFRAKAWEWICRRLSLLDKLSTRIQETFASTPRIALIAGSVIEVKSTLQLQPHLMCK